MRSAPSGGALSGVAITGLGAVGAYGVGTEALARALAGEGAPATEVDRGAGYHRPGGARTARLAAGVDLASRLTPAQARRMSPPARFAVVATGLALEQAGLAGCDRVHHDRTAVVTGTAFGPASVTESLLRQILLDGPDTASPALFTESVASAAAAHVALAIGARGPNLAITQREASDLLALHEGVRLIRTGAADRVVVAIVEEMIPLLHALLDRFRALAVADAEGLEVARPFDRDRNGLVASEGAAALLLEPIEVATARGARLLARIAATVRGFDPTASPHDWGNGHDRLAATLERGLRRSGIEAASIELVASGASGSRRGDHLEAAVLRRVFGDRIPPVTAAKGTTGEYGGAHLAAAVLATAEELSFATAGFREPDAELGVIPCLEAPPPPRRLLVSSLASGGAAAWSVLERDEPRLGPNV